MVIGYDENVNKIVVYTTDGRKLTRYLAVKGINDIGSHYTFYEFHDGLVHIIAKKDIKTLKLYHDDQLVMEL